MIDKQKIIYHLKTFSNEDRPLGASYFYDEYAEPNESLRDFQRNLAKLINEIIRDQMVYREFVICSCNDGYYIPRTEEGYIKGIKYLHSKIDEVLERIRFIEDMRLVYVYGDNKQDDIFSTRFSVK